MAQRYRDSRSGGFADIAGVSAGGERNEAALTMAEKPDARCAGFSTDHFHPGVKVDCIIINGNRICIGDSSSAVEHAALVDAHGDDALRGEPPGQKLVDRSLYTKRVTQGVRSWRVMRSTIARGVKATEPAKIALPAPATLTR